jgi:hypothetical protein
VARREEEKDGEKAEHDREYAGGGGAIQ